MPETTRHPWDAIIVGAGPAGCAAAYDLACAGRRVLLLDKSDFPRLKACAGGLTMKTVRNLRYSVDPVVRQVIYSVVLENNGTKRTLVKTREPICVMTVRSEFDAYCLARTLEVGASFRRVRGVKCIREMGDGVVVDTGDGTLQTRFLLGADGVHSEVRRFCEGAGSTVGGFALEAQVPIQAHPVNMTLDFGAVRNGYGWIFPKRDHLNVGLEFCGNAAVGNLNRERLVAYVRQRLGTDEVDYVVGQHLGVCGWDGRCAYGHILLAGDAAGLVDPLTGEGIYSAVVSGQAAAKAIDAELRGGAIASEAYHAGLGRLRETLSFSTRAARAFYASPDRGFQAISFPGLRSALIKTYAHGLNTGMGILRAARRGARIGTQSGSVA